VNKDTLERYAENIRRHWGLPRPLNLADYVARMDVDGSDLGEWTPEELAAMCRAFGIPK
jgi:hypothetical protein